MTVTHPPTLPQVTMADRAAAERACKDPNPIIDGRKANVNLAYLGAKPRIMQPGEDVDPHHGLSVGARAFCRQRSF